VHHDLHRTVGGNSADCHGWVIDECFQSLESVDADCRSGIGFGL